LKERADVMRDKYVSLSRDFTIKRSDSASILFNLVNGRIYDLSPDQMELIELFDGKMTIAQVLGQYAKSSADGVNKILGELKKISAVTFTRRPVHRVLQKNKVPENKIEAVHLEASGECNMRCVHCYQAKFVETGEKLAFGEVLHLLDDLQKMQVNSMGISGGEPLMMPYLADLLAAIEQREIRISALFTNGLLINKAFVKMVKGLRSKFSLFISLDSIPSQALSFRGIARRSSRQVLERVIESIRLLIRNGISVVVNTVVNTENLEHLDAMYDLIKGLKVTSWRLGFPKMTPSFKQHADVFNVEWKGIAESCLKLLKRHLANGMPFHIQMEYLFREELFGQGLQALSDRDFVCDYEGRRAELCVKPNGDVVSCAYCTDLPIGNIKETPIKDIWYSSQMKKIKAIKVGDVVACHGCELRDLCGTGCRANAFFLHGDFENAKDDYACMAVAFFKEQVLPLLREYNMVK
jgi:radical SAM protein with 4Fe4S-binding SPASM domain